MADPAPVARAFRSGWRRFIQVVVPVWVVCFLVVLTHVDFTLLAVVPAAVVAGMRRLLVWMMPIFLVKLVLLYRWSAEPIGVFVRKRWLDILMVLPLLRVLGFLRVFRVGRAALALRHAARLRKVFNFGRKLRRWVVRALRRRFGAPVSAAPAGPVEPPTPREIKGRAG